MPMSDVPVEHRMLGLDRRQLGGTIAVLVVVLLWSTIVPFIADAIPYDEEVASGDKIEVSAGVTIVPPVGWEIALRTALEGDALEVHTSGLIVTTKVGPFDGALPELMAAANETLDVDRITRPQNSITTNAGSTGLIESFDGVNSHGSIAVFSEDGVGVQIVAHGPEPLFSRHRDEIEQMIRSLRFEGQS